MNLVKYSLVTVFIFMQSIHFAIAQDLHFSQFFNSPITSNPANTGFLPDADYRIGGIYRDQWSSILSAPYKTYNISGDAQVLRNKIENGWLGLGAVVMSDVAGSGGLRSTEIFGSVAYHQMVASSSLISAGINLGWVNKYVDVSKLTFPDQFNSTFFDRSLPTSVSFATNTVNYFDVQVGMNYAYFPNENTYLHLGYSVLNVNRPTETFFTTNGDSSVIPLRHIIFADASLKVDEKAIINPILYFTTQAKAVEFMLGMTLNYKLTDFGEKQLIAGLYDRFGDAVIPMVGFEVNRLRFTFSYDATTSSLSNFNNSQGASEISIIKTGNYTDGYNGNKRQSMCPQF